MCRVLLAQSFLTVVASTERMSANDQQAYFDNYVAQQPGFPIIEGNDVYFLTKSDSTQPYILADFNGFLNPRYTEDKSIGLMRPIGKTTWYYFRKMLKPDAVINYKYTDGNTEWLDKHNDDERINFGDSVSFIRLGPNHNPIESTSTEKRGKSITHSIESVIQNHTRTIHVYLPPNYESEQELSSVYFHDGSFFTKEMNVPDILDNLISKELIKPIVAVFDNPVVRGKEYRGDSAYREYIIKELIPYISKSYKVSEFADKRAVIGFSRGGMSAFYLAYLTDTFSKLGALSPAIYPTSVEDFMNDLSGFSGKPKQAFITAAFYDHFWYKDAKALSKKLEEQGVKVEYIENAQGHNIPSWQTQIDDMLIAFFKQ